MTMKQYLFSFLVLALVGCYPEEKLNVDETEYELEMTALDQYIQTQFTDEYGMAIRYRYVDRYLSPGERVTPPKLEVVRPMLDFIENYWIEPYLEVPNGDEFFRDHVPAEIILLGGYIFNEDGTVTLGTADAGARITFTAVNELDPENEEWLFMQLNTVYHEFAHIVHQRYRLPTAFETIAATGYTSAGSWYNLTDGEALERGFVSPYATSSPNEDFAETVAFYLFDREFDSHFTIDEGGCADADCESRNAGRAKLRQKVSAISAHYEKVTGVSLEELREAVQSTLN
jgi:substrate import-associated zinc metallohydrolase lipoprotein